MSLLDLARFAFDVDDVDLLRAEFDISNDVITDALPALAAAVDPDPTSRRIRRHMRRLKKITRIIGELLG